jgi:hypothetical protein
MQMNCRDEHLRKVSASIRGTLQLGSNDKLFREVQRAKADEPRDSTVAGMKNDLSEEHSENAPSLI